MMNLVQEILKGNPRAIARAISLVENDGAAAQELMKAVFPHRRDAVILGVTGAPGTGKSTLVDQMVSNLREKTAKVGIVAVDPSSPFSGGAILGDRIRMMRHSQDSGVFIRSMATRGHLGGLAKATGEAIAVFEAAGMDYVIVETVGVGQDEVEVVKLAGLVLVVLTPGAGDDIQVFKAGIMEIADLFVLNKSDSPGTEQMEKQLKAMLEMGLKNQAIPPVVKTVATRGVGVDCLMDEVRVLLANKDRHFHEDRKKRLIAWMVQDLAREKIYREVRESLRESEFEDFVDQVYSRKIDPYTVADLMVRKFSGIKSRKRGQDDRKKNRPRRPGRS